MTVDTVAVYWSARHETAEGCAHRLKIFLETLTKSFPSLGEWHKKGTNRATAIANTPLQIDDEELLCGLVRSGANKRDIGNENIATLGFRIGLWNNRNGQDSISIGITCGLSSSRSGLSNAVVMCLPEDLRGLGLDSEESLERILLLHVAAWDADWGAVYSSSSSVFEQREANAPFLDKVLWIKTAESLSPYIATASKQRDVMGGTLYS